MVLLEPEVKELADATVYLDPGNPKAPLAVDLLLGTQGLASLRPHEPGGLRGDAGRCGPARAGAPGPGGDTRWQRPGPDGDEGMGRGRHALAAAENDAVAEAAVRKVVVEKVERAPAAPPPMAAMPAPVAMPVAAAPAPGEPLGSCERWLTTNSRPRWKSPRIRRTSRPSSAAGKRRPVNGSRSDRTSWWSASTRIRSGRTVSPRPCRLHRDALLARRGQDRRQGRSHRQLRSQRRRDHVQGLCRRLCGSGALGAGTAAVEAVQPFYLEPKLPLEVTDGDLITLPVSLVNGGSEALADVGLNISAPGDLRLGKVSTGACRRASGRGASSRCRSGSTRTR